MIGGRRRRGNGLAEILQQAARERSNGVGYDAGAAQSYGREAREAPLRTITCSNCGTTLSRIADRFLCTGCNQTFFMGGAPQADPLGGGWQGRGPLLQVERITGRIFMLSGSGRPNNNGMPNARDFAEEKRQQAEAQAQAEDAGAAYEERARTRDRWNQGWGDDVEEDEPQYDTAPPPSTVADAYAALDLEPGVTADDVKKRFRELALQHHPDVGGDEEDFKRINAAADLLLSHLEEDGKDEKKG